MKRRAALSAPLRGLFGLVGLAATACSQQAATAPTTGSAPTTFAVTPQRSDGTPTIPDIRAHIVELHRLHDIIIKLYPSSAQTYDQAKIELTAIAEYVRNLQPTYSNPHQLPNVIVMDYTVHQLRLDMNNALSLVLNAVEITLHNLDILYDPAIVKRGVTPTILRSSKTQLQSAQQRADLAITKVEERLPA